MLSYCECVFLRVPRSHCNSLREVVTWSPVWCALFLLLFHLLVYSSDSLLLTILHERFVTCRVNWGQIDGAEQSLVLVKAWDAAVLTPLVHEADVNGCVDSSLKINYVRMWVVTSSENHARIRRNLQVEAVEDALTFVDFAELFVQVLRHVECLHRVLRVTYIPDHDG